MLEFYICSQVGIAFLQGWPYSDIISLGRSVTCAFLASGFFTAEMFLG